jgi:8-oxo-dGTP pyrophosphatase MutT (NUDIX family)
MVCFPGGGVDAGEAHPQAALREMQEELGARITLLRCVWHTDLPHIATTLWGWYAQLDTPLLEPNPAEVSEVLWLTPEEVHAHPDALPSTAPFMEALLGAQRTEGIEQPS